MPDRWRDLVHHAGFLIRSRVGNIASCSLFAPLSESVPAGGINGPGLFGRPSGFHAALLAAPDQSGTLVPSQFYDPSVRNHCGSATSCLDSESPATHQIYRRFSSVDAHLRLLPPLSHDVSLEGAFLQHEHRSLSGVIAAVLNGQNLEAGPAVEPYHRTLWKLYFQGSPVDFDSVSRKEGGIYGCRNPILFPLPLNRGRSIEVTDPGWNCSVAFVGCWSVCQARKEGKRKAQHERCNPFMGNRFNHLPPPLPTRSGGGSRVEPAQFHELEPCQSLLISNLNPCSGQVPAPAPPYGARFVRWERICPMRWSSRTALNGRS